MIPDIDIIIPHYGGTDLTWRCLVHLWQFSPPNTRVVVVDDASPDNMPIIGEWLNRTGKAVYHRHEQNMGCTNGWNTGLTLTEKDPAPWVGFMNNDGAVMPGCIDRLLEVGEAGYNILCAQDFKIESKDSGPAFDPALVVKSLDGPCIINEDEFLSSFFVVKRELIEKLGRFDGDLKQAYGDTDFHVRASMLKEKCVAVKNAFFYHGNSVSAKRLGLDVAISNYMRDNGAFKAKWGGKLSGYQIDKPLNREELEKHVIQTWTDGEM